MCTITRTQFVLSAAQTTNKKELQFPAAIASPSAANKEPNVRTPLKGFYEREKYQIFMIKAAHSQLTRVCDEYNRKNKYKNKTPYRVLA